MIKKTFLNWGWHQWRLCATQNLLVLEYPPRPCQGSTPWVGDGWAIKKFELKSWGRPWLGSSFVWSYRQRNQNHGEADGWEDILKKIMPLIFNIGLDHQHSKTAFISKCAALKDFLAKNITNTPRNTKPCYFHPWETTSIVAPFTWASPWGTPHQHFQALYSTPQSPDS